MDAHLLAAAPGAAAGLAGAYLHRRDRARGWLPHLLMAAAMAAMARPGQDPLGPAGWMLVLGGAAAWAMGRPGPRSLPAAASGPGVRVAMRPAAALDLYAMGVLTLLMPAVQAPGHGHHGSAAGSDWWSAPYAGLLALWFAARVTLAFAEHRRCAALALPKTGTNPSVSSACSTAMITSMAVMAFAA